MDFFQRVKRFLEIRKLQWKLMSTLRRVIIVGEAIMWLGVIWYVIANQLWVLVVVPVYYIVGTYLIKREFTNSVRRAHEEFTDYE